MNNNNQNKTNWKLVFNLKVIESYLKSCELKELSLINKSFREKLKPKIFYHINVTIHVLNPEKYRFIPNNRDYETKKKVEEFLSDLCPANLFAEKISCGNLVSAFLLNTLVSACSHLRIIKLHHAYIPITTLKSIFESLNLIETITLFGITAIQWTNNMLTLTDITLPSTLKDLNICYCKSEIFEYTEDPRDFKYHNQIFENQEDMPFLFNNSTPFNLKILSLIQNEGTRINNINNFLRNQHKLKALKLEGCIINQGTIDLLANLPSFEELYILDNTFDFQYNNGNAWQVNKFPVFNQLKKLSLDYKPAYKHIKRYISSFPILIALEVRFDDEIIDRFLNILNLKKLTINCHYLGKVGYRLPSNNLDLVVVNIINPMLIDLKLLVSSRDLKFITIKFEDEVYQDYSTNDIINYYSKAEGWDFKFYYTSILCYKKFKIE